MIGVIVDEIGTSAQDYFIFKCLNKLAETQDCYLFSDRVTSLPETNKFAIMQHIEALHHPGILISTSMFNAQIARNCLTATKKFFYIWHFEWIHVKNFGFSQIENIFHNEELELIARSKSHAELISSLFKTPKGVVYNWDPEEICKVVL